MERKLTVIIIGPPASGKSALAAEIAGRLKGKKCTVTNYEVQPKVKSLPAVLRKMDVHRIEDFQPVEINIIHAMDKKEAMGGIALLEASPTKSRELGKRA